MADDRDVRKTKTPPAGVRAQTAPPVGEFDDEDLTPIEGDQATQTLKRTTQAAVTLRGIKKELANAAASQKATHLEVQAYAAKDQIDHAEMKEQFSAGIDEVKHDVREVKSDVREVKSEVKTVVDHVADVRTEVAKMSGHFEEWRGANQLAAQNQAHEIRTRTTYKYGVKKAIWKQVLQVSGVVLGAIGTGVVGYYIATYLQH